MADKTLPTLSATATLADNTIMLVRRDGQTSDEKSTLASLVTYMNDSLTIPSDAVDITFDPTGLTYVDAVQLQEAVTDLDTAIDGRQEVLTEGAFVDGDKTKLDGIAEGAEVNAVDSVNAKTGAVVLDPDDLDDAATAHKFVTASDLTNLGNLSGTNSGDQTIELTGDVTGSGTGSFAATIANSAITLAKMANLAANSIIGNNTGGSAAPSALSAGDVRTLLNVEDGADVTDATNVDSAGAIMDGDFTSNGLMKRTAAGTYATAVAGTDYVQTETDPVVGAITGIVKADGAGNISAATEDTDYQGVLSEGAFADGDKTKLDTIEDSADVTDATNVDSAGAVMESDYNANTILAATSDNTPAALTVAEQTVVGRITSGNIDALTASELRTLINVEDDADANTINSDESGVTGADQITNCMSLTTSEYGDIGSPNASTLYFITDAT